MNNFFIFKNIYSFYHSVKKFSSVKKSEFSTGFTLVEMLIAITILAFLSVYTAQTIRTAMRNKDKTAQSFDGHARTRDALQIMERDINLAFHYIDYPTQLYNISKQEHIEQKKKAAADKKNKPKSEQDKGSSSGSGSTQGNNEDDPNESPLTDEEKNFKPRPEKSYTHFIGKEQEIHLATLSHSQTRKNKAQSDQGEVSYYLKDCTNRLDKDKRSKCLVRRVASLIDDEPEKGGHETILLEDIDKFKMSYLSPLTGDEWLKEWDSKRDGISNQDQKNKFPFAVQIELSIKVKDSDKGKKDRIFQAATVAQVHFPNNQEKREYKASETKKPETPDGTTPSTPDDQGDNQ